MLHERRLPQPETDDLDKVYQIKLALLNWLLTAPPAHLNDETPLTGKFGEPVGNWLWAKIRRPETRTNFGKAVIALAERAADEPANATNVAVAIARDAGFHIHWHEAGFELKFPRLYPGWLDLVRAIAEPFYENWLSNDNGFCSTTFDLNSNITRKRIMNAFRPQSSGVCGYCDGPLGERGSEHEANDCDHFFPKSEWPHLAIHPANLYSACKGCNSTWKGAQKPMGDGDVAGLSGTYHPLLRPGVSRVSVSAELDTTNPRKVAIDIRDTTYPIRAETLNSALDINARWTNSVNEKLDSDISSYVAKTARDKGRGWQATPQTVSELIEGDIEWLESRIGKEERTLRGLAVLRYQLTHSLADLVAELQ